MKNINAANINLSTLGNVNGGCMLPLGYFDTIAKKEEYEKEQWIEQNTTFHTEEDGSGGISTVW